MHHYHKLLYISYGTVDETEGLKQALSLARNNKAPLKVLVICPEFPDNFPDYKKKYEKALLEQTELSIHSTKKTIKLEEGAIDVSVELLIDRKPAIKIIRYVLQHGYDLIIKEVELCDRKSGFRAIDMELLRKCPAPVWLCRPIAHSRNEIKVAVAIDPNSPEPAAKDLSLYLLELSRSLANSCSGELHIISCWDYELEHTLRNSAFVKMPDKEVDREVEKERVTHHDSLTGLIKKSGISDANHIHHIRGNPSEVIPDFVKKQHIDILVMGTVARTGIPGFIFGNTAENIVQNLICSLMALKPQGFISPVKAY